MSSRQKRPSFPAALAPPDTSATILTKSMLDHLIAESRKSPRKRIILPLHKSSDSNPQRMLNCLQPGTCIVPHRHLSPPKPETFILLRGKLCVILFKDTGEVLSSHLLSPEGPNFGFDLEPGPYHTIIPLQQDTVILEIKSGPYDPASDKDFAPWAPAEDSPEASGYMEELMKDPVVQKTIYN